MAREEFTQSINSATNATDFRRIISDPRRPTDIRASTAIRTRLRQLVTRSVDPVLYRHVSGRARGTLARDVTTGELINILEESERMRGPGTSAAASASRLTVAQRRVRAQQTREAAHQERRRRDYERHRPSLRADVKWSPFVRTARGYKEYTEVYVSTADIPEELTTNLFMSKGIVGITDEEQLGPVHIMLDRLFEQILMKHPFRTGIGLLAETGHRKMFDELTVHRYQLTTCDYRIVSNYGRRQLVEKIISNLKEGIISRTSDDYECVLVRCLKLYVNTVKYEPPKGSSFIELPPAIAKCKGLINVKNEDNNCFLLSLCALKHHDDPAVNSHRRNDPAQYQQFLSEWTTKEISPFPADPSAMRRFEKDNHVRIYLHSFENGRFYPFMPSKHHTEFEWPVFNLLLLVTDQRTHYVAITKTSTLVRSSRSDASRNALFVCPSCYYSSRDQTKIKEHERMNCPDMVNGCAIVKCPEPGPSAEVRFKSPQKMLRIPIIATMDYEALLIRIASRADAPAHAPAHAPARSECASSSVPISDHVPSHVCITLKVDDDWASDFSRKGITSTTVDFDIVNDGPEFWKRAIDFLIRVQEAYSKVLKDYTPKGSRYKPYTNTPELVNRLRCARECYLCHSSFTGSDKAVVDHDHRTGEVRGIAHTSCNASYNLARSYFPVFIHNLRGYDEKFLIPELATYSDWEISPLANSSEKFMMLKFSKRGFSSIQSKNPIVFLDSMQHFGGSIDSNVKQLLAGCLGADGPVRSTFVKAIYDRQTDHEFIRNATALEIADKAAKGISSAVSAFFDDAAFVCSPKWSSPDFHGPRNIFRNAIETIVRTIADCFASHREAYIARTASAINVIEEFLLSKREIIANKFRNTIAAFGPELAYLFCKKGCMPYEYLSSIERLQEPTLPPLEQWKDTLDGGNVPISRARYDELCDIFRQLQCHSILEFQHYYVRSDTTLLMDCIENWREYIHSFVNLDPAYFVGTAGIAWDAMLLHIKGCATTAHLMNMTELDMHHLVKTNIRGGISVISAANARANNPLCPDYDPSKPTSWILYLDANQLYGSVMKWQLPLADYKWVSPPDNLAGAPDPDAIAEFIKNGPQNRFYLVDTHCPEELHDYFNDYPLQIHMRQARYDEQSPLMKRMIHMAYGGLREASIASQAHAPSDYNTKTPKLIPSLEDEHEHLHHARNLAFMIDHGIKITRIHKIIEFTESDWMSSYIDKLNSERVKWKTTNKSLYAIVKLLGNAVYGRTLMNVMKHRDMRIVSDEDQLVKLNGKFNCKSTKPIIEGSFDDGEQRIILSIVNMGKKEIILNQPIAIGFTVLEYSKLHMQRFYYDVLKATYGPRVRLLATDTDSLIVHIETQDMINDIKTIPALRESFDLSQESAAHFTSEERARNDGIYGKFKTEQPFTNQIVEFIGLRSKMYNITTADQKSKSTAKGIDRSTKARVITAATFREALLKGRTSDVSCARIVSRDLKLRTIVQRKMGLVAVNDKRYYLDDIESSLYIPSRPQTLAFGHRQIAALREHIT